MLSKSRWMHLGHSWHGAVVMLRVRMRLHAFACPYAIACMCVCAPWVGGMHACMHVRDAQSECNLRSCVLLTQPMPTIQRVANIHPPASPAAQQQQHPLAPKPNHGGLHSPPAGLIFTRALMAPMCPLSGKTQHAPRLQAEAAPLKCEAPETAGCVGRLVVFGWLAGWMVGCVVG